MLFRKENKVQELIRKHLETVGEAVSHWEQAFLCYLKGDKEDSEDKARATIELETKADKIRKEAQEILYGGAYLPLFREDLLDFLELVDNIADDAERGVDFLHIEYPEIPSSWHEGFKKIVEKNHKAFSSLKEAFEMLHEKRSSMLSYTHKVQEAEKEVDKLQDELMREIFQSELSLAHKIQLRDLILAIGFVSDSSENASDKIGLIATKGRI